MKHFPMQPQTKTGATNPTPSACDIALDGMIVLLARHISREMTSVDQPQESKGMRTLVKPKLGPKEHG